MAVVRKAGKPSLFITMTCNPAWPEIRDALAPGQQAADRPDLCARMFRAKQRALLDDLIRHSVLGKVVGYTWVIEFQNRGLPHCHILLILDETDQIRTPEGVDRVVCAEIPDRTANPVLYETVKKCVSFLVWIYLLDKTSNQFFASLCHDHVFMFHCTT